ncbi:MAG: hypothetical protein WCP85_05040 [Mariniphaga sp.]
MKKLFGLLLIIIGLVGCHDYTEIKNDNLKSAFIMNSSPTFIGYFYEGSDNTFHYFTSRWKLDKDNYFKIPINKLKVSEKLKFERNNTELRIDVFENGNNEFAENEYYKLYVVNAR